MVRFSNAIAPQIMKNNISFEAMPQLLGQLDEKVDALTAKIEELSRNLSNPNPIKKEELVGINIAAKILHLSESRVHALVQEGRLPYYKPGRKLLFLPSELQKWLLDGKRTGQPSIETQMESMSKGMRNSAKGRRFV